MTFRPKQALLALLAFTGINIAYAAVWIGLLWMMAHGPNGSDDPAFGIASIFLGGPMALGQFLLICNGLTVVVTELFGLEY